MKKWIFNPFQFIAGARALSFGILFMTATAAIGAVGGLHFDGVIDVHVGAHNITMNVIEQLADWLTATILFYVAGRIFSTSSIRIIDVAGTLALARWPLIFCSIAQLFIRANPHLSVGANGHPVFSSMGDVVAFGLVCLVFGVWSIVLMYYAFAVSCNLKGPKLAGAFAGALVASEVISKIIIYLALKTI